MSSHNHHVTRVPRQSRRLGGKPIHQSFHYFLFMSAAAVVLILLLVGFGLRGVMTNYVITEVEWDASNLTDAIRDAEARALIHENSTGEQRLAIDPDEILQLDRRMRVFLSHFEIVKIKIFDRDFRIIYSTDLDIIGKLDLGNPKLTMALSGTPVSKFEVKGHVWDLADESQPQVSIVESYVPVVGRGGKIIGSFEIYKDVTSYLTAGTNTLIRSVGIVALALLVVFTVLSVLMYQVTHLIRKHESALENSEARIRAIVDTAADGVITCDDKGIVQSFNTAAQGIFGYTSDQVIGQNVKMLMPPPDQDQHDNYLSRYLRTGEKKMIGRHSEVSGIRKDGTAFPLWLAISEVKLHSERLYTAIVRDLTEKKKAEMQLRQQDILRAEQMSIVAQLATGVAHELRNPLTSIKLLVQSNREEAASRGVPIEDLNVIEQEILRMERSLETFLSFARPSKSDRRQFNLLDVIDHVITLVEGRLKKQSVRCSALTPPSGQVLVEADRDRVQQLLLNLVLNALDMMPTGGTLSINLKSPENGRVSLEVGDSGPGIAPEVFNRLFEPFMTTKETGVGLGLVESRRIAEEHGGTLTAHNRSAGGACFVVHLPIVR